MMKRRLILPYIAIPVVLLTLSCSGVDKVKTSLVTITVGSAENATLRAEPKTAWNRAIQYFSGLLQTEPAAAAVPSSVTDVRVTVAAVDMAAITTTAHVAGLPDVTITLEVPNGSARTFLVEGLTAAGIADFSGQTTADLTGEPVTLTITLILIEPPITPVDAVLPTFAGLRFTSIISLSSTTLNWDPATDNVSPAANITYLVYQATTPGGEIFTAPTYTVPAGATSFGVTNLTPGTTYYFVVRAMDQAGNIDTNTAEFSFVYPGLYVDGTTGKDTNPCTQAAPCLTIEQALLTSPGNEGVFVSAGTYTVPINGWFLRPFTQLACIGPNFTTVLSPSGAISLKGNTGALIDGCRLNAPTGAVAAIDDNLTGITVNNCLIQGDGIGTLLGISLGANSVIKNSTLALIGNANSGDAITVQSGNPIITGNTITGGNNGVTIRAGSPTISNNIISNNVGAGLSSGILTSSTDTIGPAITGNTIRDNQTGITVQIGTPTISGNTIINNSVTPTSAGINIALANPKVINNTISNNSIGITVNGSAGTDPVINNNSIFCNIVEDMNTSILQAFDATNNSWDHASPLPITGGALPCPAGTDICILGPTAPTLAPYGPVVATPCTP